MAEGLDPVVANIIDANKALEQEMTCGIHNKTKRMFCFDCKKLLCRDCIVIDHAGHKCEHVVYVAPAARQNLSERLNLLPDLTTAMIQVKETKKQIQAQKTLTEKNVNAKFQELHDILEQCKARVLQEHSVVVSTKMEKLTTEEKDLELSLSIAQSLIDFVDNASNENLLTMEEQVVSRIDAEVVRREAVGAHLVENSCSDVDVFAADNLKKLCDSVVVAHVSGDGIKMAEVDSCAQFSIFTSSDKKQPQAILKSLVDGSSQQLPIVSVGGGVYNVQYTPKIRGRHHLLISVEDQPVPGSPFSVFVKLHPTKLDKPVRKIAGITSYHGAVNSLGELILTNSRPQSVVVLDRLTREKIQSIANHEFKGVKGVAVDKDDNIYISDSDNHCVCKFNAKVILLKKFGRKGNGVNELNYPRGIAIAGDRVFVCDSHNKRIQVLTTELEPVKVIDGIQIQEPRDVAVDDKQMLYIADGSYGVKVLTMDGQLKHHFDKDMDTNVGICVDSRSGFVYVSDRYEPCVHVFTRDGQFVTSFGEGHIHTGNPLGITMDNDGFVYVCTCNNRTELEDGTTLIKSCCFVF